MSNHVIENADGTVSFRCPSCGGPSHPAVGCAYTPTFVVCAGCTARFHIWFNQFRASKGRRDGGLAFYDYVNRVS